MVGEDVSTEGPGRSSCARHSVGVDEVLRIGKGPLSFDVCLRRYGNVSMLKKAPGAILEAVTVKAERCSAHVSAENRASRQTSCKSAVQRHSSCVTPLHRKNDSGSSDDYVYGPSGTPIEQVSQSSGASTYLYTDQLGSVTMEADQSGNVVGTQSYSPYGTLASSTGTDPTPFGFAGGYTDPTGLIYLINRYYDPATGQFLSVDAYVAYSQEAYGYAYQNPANSKDATGLLSWPFPMGGCSLAVGLCGVGSSGGGSGGGGGCGCNHGSENNGWTDVLTIVGVGACYVADVVITDGLGTGGCVAIQATLLSARVVARGSGSCAMVGDAQDVVGTAMLAAGEGAAAKYLQTTTGKALAKGMGSATSVALNTTKNGLTSCC